MGEFEHLFCLKNIDKGGAKKIKYTERSVFFVLEVGHVSQGKSNPSKYHKKINAPLFRQGVL
jgi:hypothetical protein